MTFPHNIAIISYVERLWRSAVHQWSRCAIMRWHNMHLRCIIWKCVHHSVCPDTMTPLIAARNSHRRSLILNATSWTMYIIHV